MPRLGKIAVRTLLGTPWLMHDAPLQLYDAGIQNPTTTTKVEARGANNPAARVLVVQRRKKRASYGGGVVTQRERKRAGDVLLGGLAPR